MFHCLNYLQISYFSKGFEIVPACLNAKKNIFQGNQWKYGYQYCISKQVWGKPLHFRKLLLIFFIYFILIFENLSICFRCNRCQVRQTSKVIITTYKKQPGFCSEPKKQHIYSNYQQVQLHQTIYLTFHTSSFVYPCKKNSEDHRHKC